MRFDTVRRGWLAHRALMPWFLLWNVQHLGAFGSLYGGSVLGGDGRLYIEAARVWLTGGNPWAAHGGINGATFHYANPPITVEAFAPLSLLPAEVGVWIWLLMTWAAAIYLLWRLHLPGWFLLFPPLTEGALAGNPHVVMLALLVAGSGMAKAVAPAMKVYAMLPMLGERRWRALTGAALLVGLSVFIAPGQWIYFVGHFAQISAALAAEAAGGFSAFYDPPLLLITLASLAALALVDRRAAGWLAVPAAWPATQFFYSTMAMPVASWFLLAGLAVPIRELPAVVVIAYSWWRVATWAVQGEGLRGLHSAALSTRIRTGSSQT